MRHDTSPDLQPTHFYTEEEEEKEEGEGEGEEGEYFK